MAMVEADPIRADLYHMVMNEHVHPFGLKARDLLEREGFDVSDHPLTSRAETEAFKLRHGVETTPQIFIEGRRIGGKEAPRDPGSVLRLRVHRYGAYPEIASEGISQAHIGGPLNRGSGSDLQCLTLKSL